MSMMSAYDRDLYNSWDRYAAEQESLMEAWERETEEKITAKAKEKLINTVGSSTFAIWTIIKDDVIQDVFDCHNIADHGEFTDEDVAEAIGAAILSKINPEMKIEIRY